MKNKFILSFLISLFSIPGIAVSNNFSIEVTGKNHLGVVQFDKIVWKERKLSVNNATLEKILYPLALSDLQALRSTQSSDPKVCRLGQFEMKGGKRIISGCLEDDSYKTVRASIQHLKYLALLSSD